VNNTVPQPWAWAWEKLLALNLVRIARFWANGKNTGFSCVLVNKNSFLLFFMQTFYEIQAVSPIIFLFYQKERLVFKSLFIKKYNFKLRSYSFYKNLIFSSIQKSDLRPPLGKQPEPRLPARAGTTTSIHPIQNRNTRYAASS